MNKHNEHEAPPLTADDLEARPIHHMMSGYADDERAWHDPRADPPYVDRAAFNWKPPGDGGLATFVAEPGYIAIFDSWTIAAEWHPLLLPVTSVSAGGDAKKEGETQAQPVAIIHPDEHIEELASKARFDSLEDYMNYRRYMSYGW